MRIVGGEAIPIRIALKKPFKIASGTLTHSNLCWFGWWTMRAAAMHFYAATPAVISATEILGSPFYEDDMVYRSIGVVNGAVALPQSPGLGVTIDEGKVARYRHQF